MREDFFQQLFEKSEDEKERDKYFNTYYTIKDECIVYKFFLTKHYKIITTTEIEKRFKKESQLNYAWVYIGKKPKLIERKNNFIVRPLVWVNQQLLIKYNKEPRLFFRIIKIPGTERTYILTEKKDIPFYLMRKYGRKQGVEKEIFKEVKYIRKKYEELNNKIIKEIKKKQRKERRKQWKTQNT